MANSRLCSIPDCGKIHYGKGFCQNHYLRLRKHGDPLGGHFRYRERQRYYLSVVLPYDGDECLLWPYSNTRGYGRVNRDGKEGLVTRFLCEDVYGPPPTPEHEAAHSCGNGHLGCVTKSHLRWATPKDNNADKRLHGTHQRGEKVNLAKLTEPQAKEIILLKRKEPQAVTACRYGVSVATISQIQNGKSWSWLHQ